MHRLLLCPAAMAAAGLAATIGRRSGPCVTGAA